MEFSDVRAEDQQEIGKTLLRLLRAFRERDAAALTGPHTRGGSGISTSADQRSGTRRRRRTLDRENFSLRALQRQRDGSWLIVSEMFQDANTETTYAH
jgi:hypothetical protein